MLDVNGRFGFEIRVLAWNAPFLEKFERQGVYLYGMYTYGGVKGLDVMWITSSPFVNRIRPVPDSAITDDMLRDEARFCRGLNISTHAELVEAGEGGYAEGLGPMLDYCTLRKVKGEDGAANEVKLNDVEELMLLAPSLSHDDVVVAIARLADVPRQAAPVADAPEDDF